MIVDVVHGFLGTGKTTFIRNLVGQVSSLEKVVVLVNEFGELGIDGMLLTDSELEVVELASGCICCSLGADLLAQVQNIAKKINPDRLLVEPSGIATIESIIKILSSLRLEKYVQGIRVFLLVDSTDFDVLAHDALSFFTKQLSFAQFVIINKCDLVSPERIVQIRETISKLSPRVRVLTTTYGKIDLAAFNESDYLPGVQIPDVTAVEHGIDYDHDHGHSHARYQSLSLIFKNTFALAKLQELFDVIGNEVYGIVFRAKGIFHTDQGWMYVDFSSHVRGERALAGNFEESRVVIIGSILNSTEITRSIKECLV